MRSNSMSIKEFVLQHLIWSLIAFIWYRMIFRCIGNMTLFVSELVLFGMVALISTVYGVFECRSRRNGFSIFINLITGFGLYTISTYYSIHKELIHIIFFIAILFSAVISIYIMRKTYKYKKTIQKALKRIIRSLALCQIVFGMGMLLVLTIVCSSVLFSFRVEQFNTYPVGERVMGESFVENDVETIALLAENNWTDLSLQKKIDVLQAIANNECNYLGLPNELTVRSVNLDKDTLGMYVDQTHEILINTNCLRGEGFKKVLEIILHEAYHSFEHRCWDVYKSTGEDEKRLRLFQSIVEYGREFENYESGKNDFNSYYFQKSEIDCREYAKQASERYLELINNYRGGIVAGAK